MGIHLNLIYVLYCMLKTTKHYCDKLENTSIQSMYKHGSKSLV